MGRSNSRLHQREGAFERGLSLAQPHELVIRYRQETVFG
jgi:hypothetical protein